MLFIVIAVSLTCLGTVFLLANLVRKDYLDSIAQGSGGTPSSFLNYLEISFFRIFRSSSNLALPKIPAHLNMQRGFLESLPVRSNGLRPRVIGIAPQRQITQVGPKHMISALSQAVIDFGSENESRCYLGRSTFKNANTALFARSTKYTSTRYPGEICHAHPNDGSMHLNLHPADVKTVIEGGWGERHPLAREGRIWNLICPIPAGLTLTYCPRDEKELEVMERVIRAAQWWVSGVDEKIAEEGWA